MFPSLLYLLRLKEDPLVNFPNPQPRLKGFRWDASSSALPTTCDDVVLIFREQVCPSRKRAQTLGTRNYRVLICYLICVGTTRKKYLQNSENR